MLRKKQKILKYLAVMAGMCLLIGKIANKLHQTRSVPVTNVTEVLSSPALRERIVQNINCKKLIAGDKKETQEAHIEMQSHPQKTVPDSLYIEMTRNCGQFISGRGYITKPLSEEERSYPIAFSILMYKEVEQAERFLRSIYQPQNIYCIHIDRDSPEVVHEAMRGIAGCLPNVFIVSKLESIIYGGYSRLQADLNCMADLLQKNVSWKYLINQPSQAFPLRTNAELVKILKIYNGSNDIEGKRESGYTEISHRTRYRYVVRYPWRSNKAYVVITNTKKDKPPYSLTITKGSAYGAFSRTFIHYILNDEVPRKFLRWCKDTYSPDEVYWSTLHHLMDNPILYTPGGYKGLPHKKSWQVVYASWMDSGPCHGQHIRDVCIFGVKDLTALVKRTELFVNKFYLTYQHLALDCMEEYMYNRTLEQPFLDYSFYRNLSFVKH